jgi:hypothetical protein
VPNKNGATEGRFEVNAEDRAVSKGKETGMNKEQSDLLIFKCPYCHNDLKVKKESSGKKGQCPICRCIISIPDEVA